MSNGKDRINVNREKVIAVPQSIKIVDKEKAKVVK